MAFRADESAHNNFERVKNYLISRDIDMSERGRSEEMLLDIVDKYGPAVESYPSWHPLVTHHNSQYPEKYPTSECGYKGLDHTRHFVNAFITCPYHDGQKIIDSVNALPPTPVGIIQAKRLDVQLYQPTANPILVYCEWRKVLPINCMIPASLAVPLMLQKELHDWDQATCAETWETMRPYFLGSPHGSRSSLFVNQETALTMKKLWNLLINTGMYGNIRVSNQY